MPDGAQLHFFIEGYKPFWENSKLKDGARFQIKVPKSQTSLFWEDILLALIGEQFPEDLVVGVILCIKHDFNKIQVWIKDCSLTDEVDVLK